MKPLSYALALLVMVPACGMDDFSDEASTTSVGQIITTVADTTTTGLSIDMSLPEGFSRSALEEIVADAAARTGVPISEIEVISVEAMTFNDAGLGCPEPGKMYAQVLTPGYVVLVQASSSELDYRTDEVGDLVKLCK